MSDQDFFELYISGFIVNRLKRWTSSFIMKRRIDCTVCNEGRDLTKLKLEIFDDVLEKQGQKYPYLLSVVTRGHWRLMTGRYSEGLKNNGSQSGFTYSDQTFKLILSISKRILWSSYIIVESLFFRKSLIPCTKLDNSTS